MGDVGDVLAVLEAAERGSRELDEAIAILQGWYRGETQGHPAWIDPAGTTFWDYVPFYTRSLDTALTLVPEGWDVVDANSNGGQWCFTLGRCDCGHPLYQEARSWEGERDIAIFNRKPPALALCVAALRARAAQPDAPQGGG